MSSNSPRGAFRDDVLAGKRILVTGGGTGLGKEITRFYIAHGALVHICGRRQAVLEATVAELSPAARHGGADKAHACDIRDADAVDALVEACWQDGPLTGLVNNAAANFISPSVDISPRGFAAVRSTVMDGALFATLACGRRWIAQGLPGSVVSMLVTWVWTGSAYVLPSAMAKTAVHAMTQSLAVEWGRYGIRVNAVAPGPFPTESAWEKLAPIPKANVGAASAAEVPMGRFGEMPELAHLMTFLQADGCDYLTGQTIGIDGGHHLAAPSTFAALGALTAEDWAQARSLVRGKAEQEKAQRSVDAAAAAAPVAEKNPGPAASGGTGTGDGAGTPGA